MMQKIDTSRLYICRPTMEDSLKLEDLWRNDIVQQFLGGVVEDDIIKERIATIQKHWDQHGFGLGAVYIKTTEQIVGLCGLHHSDDGIEVSYKFFPTHWGHGLAKEAILACINYGFTIRQVSSIIAISQEANQRSCRLLESIGMKQIQSFIRFNALQRLYEINRDVHIR